MVFTYCFFLIFSRFPSFVDSCFLFSYLFSLIFSVSSIFSHHVFTYWFFFLFSLFPSSVDSSLITFRFLTFSQFLLFFFLCFSLTFSLAILVNLPLLICRPAIFFVFLLQILVYVYPLVYYHPVSVTIIILLSSCYYPVIILLLSGYHPVIILLLSCSVAYYYSVFRNVTSSLLLSHPFLPVCLSVLPSSSRTQ